MRGAVAARTPHVAQHLLEQALMITASPDHHGPSPGHSIVQGSDEVPASDKAVVPTNDEVGTRKDIPSNHLAFPCNVFSTTTTSITLLKISCDCIKGLTFLGIKKVVLV